MLIDPSALANIFNPKSVELTNQGSSPDLFTSILKQNSNEEEVVKQQNYYDLNRFNLGTGFQVYLMGGTNSPPASDFPRYNIFEGAGRSFSQGFRPSAPPTTESLKNSFALEGGIYQPFA